MDRRIDPTRPRRPDGSPDDNDRVEIGPTALAFAEWQAAGLAPPDLAALRRGRLDRLVAGVVARDLGGLLLFDPLSIRYATDSTNMQVWNTHNPFRACLVLPDGHVVLWDYKHAPFLATHNPLVAELRSGASFFYSVTGEATDACAAGFAGRWPSSCASTPAATAASRSTRSCSPASAPSPPPGSKSRTASRSPNAPAPSRDREEIRAMRCALHACETAMAAMRAAARPGLSEDDIWAVLHAENIRRGGEWIETRLLASGPRTNPWFQECGPRIVQPDEILAFDTDLIGAYGYCADISRTWWIGDGTPRPDMRADYRLACDQIAANTALLRPGTSFAELHDRAFALPAPYRRQRYSCMFHGVGLCDEWPYITYPEDRMPGAFEGVLEPGMTLCVESLISREGGDFSIKLEEQVLVTEAGPEVLSRFPHDPALYTA